MAAPAFRRSRGWLGGFSSANYAAQLGEEAPVLWVYPRSVGWMAGWLDGTRARLGSATCFTWNASTRGGLARSTKRHTQALNLLGVAPKTCSLQPGTL
jgi:hypothetical protein